VSTAPGSVTPANWQDAPHSRWAFGHLEAIVPSAVVSRGTGAQLPLPAARRALDDLPVDGAARGRTLGVLLEATSTDAFVVLHDGRLVYERYDACGGAHQRHLLMSISKSLCGVAACVLAEERRLDLAAAVEELVPELRHSGFARATVEQVLDMTASVAFDEDYDRPGSDAQRQDRVAGWRPRRDGDPDDGYAFLATIRPEGRHGTALRYCSATTDVLAWVLERASGRRYPQLLSELVWSRIGAEHDGSITVDRAGFGFANAGVSTTALDLARFGHLVLCGGAEGAHRLCSRATVAAILAGGDRRLLEGMGFTSEFPNGSYRLHWFVTGNEHGVIEGRGIHGQYLWIDPAARIVIVKLSSVPQALVPGLAADVHRGFAAITAALT
jgi:6-aminohexanoate-oligomer exohydrolase